MKKSVLKVVLIVMTVMLVLAIFSSCNKDGEQDPAEPAGPQGVQGVQGKPGISIESITKTASDGLVDTYTITMTDGTTTTFTVTNGAGGEQGPQGNNGKDGRGIASTELINGELIVIYTDGTKENLGKIFSTDNNTTGNDDVSKLWYTTPEMHGAIGDGVNDDAGAFTNAINDSDYVFLTNDLYLLTPVAITGKKQLIIDGNGYTINCKNIERAFQITDSTNIIFKNIIFDGNSCTTQGVLFVDCENIQVENCTFKNMATTSATDGDTWGLNFRDSKDMRVDFCSFVNIDGSGNSTKVANGIVVHGHTKGCENITISNCYFDTILPVNDACGISLNQTNFYDTPLHGVVENCRFVDCAKRAVKIMAQNVTVQNCDIKDVLSTDIHASMIDIMASHCRVTNNIINVNRATYGISCQYVAETSTITGFDDIIIENNYINVANEDSTNARDGLTIGIVDDTKKYTEVTVKNNVVKGHFRYAFKAMNVSNSVIDGNTFDGEVRLGNRSLNDRPCNNIRIVNNTLKGTFEASVTHSLLAHNEFIDNGGFGIYFPTYTNGSPSNLRIIGNNFNNLSYGIHTKNQALDNVIITDNVFTNITTSDMLLNGTNYVVEDNILCKGISGTFEVTK